MALTSPGAFRVEHVFWVFATWVLLGLVPVPWCRVAVCCCGDQAGELPTSAPGAARPVGVTPVSQVPLEAQAPWALKDVWV